MLQRSGYAPYGELMYLVDGSWNAIVDSLTIYMYTGQEFDGDDVYYYGARYYDPVLGRFLQADTILDGMNRYAYCGNNPVRYVDPTGHVEVDYANMNEAHAAEEAAEMAAEEARSRRSSKSEPDIVKKLQEIERELEAQSKKDEAAIEDGQPEALKSAQYGIRGAAVLGGELAL